MAAWRLRIGPSPLPVLLEMEVTDVAAAVADEASALIQAVEADREIIKPSDMSSEELEAVVQGLDDVQHGRTKSLLQIDAEIELS